MAKPRRGIITPELRRQLLWARIRITALTLGTASVTVAGISYGARIGTSNQQVAAVSSTAPTYHRTPSVDRWGTRTPLLATPTATPDMMQVTPTPTATPRKTPTPTKTARPVATTTKPVATKATTTTKAAQPAGECRNQLSGITVKTRAVHNALCANFPAFKEYGGYRNERGSYHGSGQAIDAMTPNAAAGNAMAAWARANASRYGITEVIWAQRIWTSQRSSEGWRWMADRGSVTQNHYDHVHISVGG